MTTARSPRTRAVKPETSPDVDALTTESDEIIELSSGSVVRVERLRTRQLFKALKIVTRGLGDVLPALSLEPENREAFAGQMVGLLVMAIPDAEDETIEFVSSMVSPADLNTHPRLTKADRAENDAKIDALRAELDNPDLDDLVSIIEAVIHNEAGNIAELGKRLGAMFNTMNVAQLGAKS